jgi:uncharacterized membrane protein YhaH (DUF805 family)
MQSHLGSQIWWALMSLDGRMGQKAYFWASLLPVIAFAAMTTYLVNVLFPNDASAEQVNLFEGIYALIYLAFLPLSVWMYIALTVKRLHDLSYPGIIVLLVAFPIVLLPGYLFMCLMPGTDGSNKYGPHKNARKTGSI